MITIRNYEKLEIGTLEGKPGIEVLQEGLKAMYREQAWVSSGTLLGLYRDKQLIPFDTDVDVNVLRHKNDTSVVQLPPRFELVRTMDNDGIPMQTAYIKDGVLFDIYYFYSGIEDDVAINYNDHGIIKKPLKFVDPLSTYRLNGFTYPVPSRLHEFLTWRFGEHWKVPKLRKDSWEQDHANLLNQS